MVITRNQSRFLPSPLIANINPESKVGNNERVGGNNPGESHHTGVANSDHHQGKMGGGNGGRQPQREGSIVATFLAETSIHGVKYIVQENRHLSERVFWLAAFVMGVLSSAYLIHGVWDRYHQTPIIVTFDAKEVAINSIPFPAVTICNNNLISKRLISELKRTLNETSPSDPKHIEAERTLEVTRFICQETDGPHQIGKNMDDLIAFLLKNTDPCDEMIKKCSFGWERPSCTSLFKPLITGSGKCCTFNTLPLGLLFKRANKTGGDIIRNTIVEEQYFTKPAEIRSWSDWEPLKQQGLGYGLEILIDSKLDDYYCPLYDFEGIGMHIHSPYEAPNMGIFQSMVPVGKYTHVRVNADITKADPDIRQYPQKKRICYFKNEKQLKFHRPYSRGNCYAECYGDYMAKKCGCLIFEFPNYHPEHEGKAICGRNHIPCIGDEISNINKDGDQICPGCDPLCEEIKYGYKMSSTNLLSSHQAAYTLREKGQEINDSLAIVRVFFDSERSVPKLRKALSGWADLIANTGGILGLCLGFSVLSGIELAYFFALRAFCNRPSTGASDVCGRTMVGWLRCLRRLRVKVNKPSPELRPAEEGMSKVAGM